MTYRLLSGSCDVGPCPTFYMDDLTGDVMVQGYLTGEQPVSPPPGEGFVHIPAEAWQTLLSRLPRA